MWRMRGRTKNASGVVWMQMWGVQERLLGKMGMGVWMYDLRRTPYESEMGIQVICTDEYVSHEVFTILGGA